MSDDNEPITLDWMLAIGFKRYISELPHKREDKRQYDAVNVMVEGRPRIAVWCYDGVPDYWSTNMFSHPKCAYPQNRGDVRRLCLAMGFRPKE